MPTTFSLTPGNVFIRNAQVAVRLTSSGDLTDTGLVASVKVDFKPINSESTLGAATAGYDVTLTADMLQTALDDVQAALGVAGSQVPEIHFIGDTDRIVVKNFMVNPTGAMDMSGGESKVTLATHRKMIRSQASALQYSYLDSQPAVPASDSPYTNASGSDCYVVVSGGTVSDIAVSGSSTGKTSGTFLVPDGETITLTYTVAPTWKWYGN